MKKLAALILSLIFVLGGAALAESSDKSIKVGVCPGPYGDLFADAIQPGLEELGYTVEIVEFADYVQPNLQLAAGEIDVNLFQHLVYLNNFAAEHELSLKALAFVPTAGAGLYSNTITALDAIPEGAQVAISNDVTNQARALRVLQSAGLIKVNPDADSSQLTPDDVTENPLDLEIVPVEAAQTPRALDSADLALVNGNYAIGAGLDLSKALYTEVLEKDLKNVVVIRESDAGSQLEQDLYTVLKSDAYNAVLESPDYIYYTFQKPDYQLYD